MTDAVAGLASQTPATPGTSIIAIDVNQSGGYIVNPSDPVDQGQASTATPAVLYVNNVTNAQTAANGTTLALQPGQGYNIIPNASTPVSVASKIANHSFTAVMWP
jgi:hypothetical protein